MSRYVFVLCPPYSGSTLLWRLLQTSPNTSALKREGQKEQSVWDILWPDRWNAEKEIPWNIVRDRWDRLHDSTKPLFLEKSPPHLVRAQAIEAHFPDAAFVIMIRNPYAFCEGFRRRGEGSLESAARFWAMAGAQQIRNIQTIKKSVSFTYEMLTDAPDAVCERLLTFIPDLRSLNIHAGFRARSIFGPSKRRISNINRVKMNRLSSNDIASINSVLHSHKDTLDFFGYNYIEPTLARSMGFNALWSEGEILWEKVLARVSRKYERVS
jgi:hypothetical protein